MFKIHPLGIKSGFQDLNSAISIKITVSILIAMSFARALNSSFSTPKTKFKHTLNHGDFKNLHDLVSIKISIRFIIRIFFFDKLL